MAIIFLEANNTGTTSDAMRLAIEYGYDLVFVTMQQEFYQTLPDNPMELCGTVITVCDSFNVSEVLSAIRHIDVEAVISFDDYHLVTAALCAMVLGLPHADVPGLVAARYKDMTRELTRDPGNTPWFQTVPEDEIGKTDLESLTYPLVVKPVDESGSVSVRLCHTPADVRAVTDLYRAHVVNVRGYRPRRTVLLEQFIEGDEYSCELYWDAEQGWCVAGITQKFLGGPPHFVERGHVFPAPPPAPLARQIGAQALRWVEAIGLRGGAAHIELRVHAGDVHLIEINPRLPGGHITQLVKWCTGIDMVARYLDCHLRDKIAAPEPEPQFAAAASRFVMPDEVSDDLTPHGLRTLLTRLATHQRGQVRPDAWSAGQDARSNYDRIGYVLLAGPDQAVREDLDALARDLGKTARR
ncbi:ATP-grasp domain-containing protein [Streptomyces tailanensis]|uniref:ATP-grasp domain-containing protein n=1 Tax=Streptomyces tailanensis TaxID=2569858 RepID=UPI00122E7AD7|nr:ATP-grasp domain-containing protein [Streptomyces tailanensis]